MRNTVQKEVILSTVLASCDHPDAETICERARTHIPALSLGTVYRNLAQLATDGKIRRIAIPDSGDRFDNTLSEHAHFHCIGCGKVFDVNFAKMEKCKEALVQSERLTLTRVVIVFEGLCPDCTSP